MNPISESCDVSILMPCLNEERTVAGCVGNALEALEDIRARYGLSGEVVVADNGSTDASREVAAAAGARIVSVARKGYGNCLSGAFDAARGRFMVMGDADGSYDFREAAPMIGKLLDGYALCLGTRMRGRIMPGAMPFKNRYLGNPALTGILNLLFRSRLSDAHAGLRALTRDAYARLRLSSAGMEFASEMLIKASLLNLPRTEVPITLHRDKRDRPPHLRPWRDGWRHLRYILILAPDILFIWPALLMGLAALGLAIPILAFNDAAHVGKLIFGVHWMVAACTAAVISHILFLFGLGGLIYGLHAGYRTPPRWLFFMRPLLSLEASLILGAVALLVSLTGIGVIVFDWIKLDFHNPGRLREIIACCALLIIGVQHLFGGFLLSILSGNRADFLSEIPP